MNVTKNQINLYPLGKDKDIIIKTFSENEDIISLILPTYNKETATEDLDIILKRHLYKTIEIDNTQGDSKVYICVETYIPLVDSDTIKEIGIVINVFCHESLLDLSQAETIKSISKGLFGNRIDQTIDLIDRCLNGKQDMGIGKLRLRNRNPIGIYQPKNNYYGKSMEYVLTDFNVLHKS